MLTVRPSRFRPSRFRPSRVRFTTGVTAERLQQRRDAAAIAAFQEWRQFEQNLERISALMAADQSAGEVAAILSLFA